MGVTILLSTHQMNKVEELCDRALMINHGQMVLFGTVQEIRRQHADHAVVVRAPGRIESVPGVISIEPMNGNRRGLPSGAADAPAESCAGGCKLTLAPDATPQSVLRALLERGVQIESFEIAALPLEDIFVKVAREEPARAGHGPPAAMVGTKGAVS